MKLIYEGQSVTQENAKTIVSKFGWTSGDKLYKRFLFYYKTANRIAYPYPRNLQKLKNKIDLFESAIGYLPFKKQDKAKDELKILQNLYNVEDQ